ncbi:MAG: hypothetical protein KDE55_06415 [Novosphingobium sp.]|nr:hypothetical protein [Novosphingobium sp.]
MRAVFLPALIASGFFLSATGTQAASTPTNQAVENYVAVVSGKKAYRDLTPRERAQVDAIARHVRDKDLAPWFDDRTFEEKCRDAEHKSRDETITPLEQRVIDMKCREAW